jgi:hypothetical protein
MRSIDPAYCVGFATQRVLSIDADGWEPYGILSGTKGGTNMFPRFVAQVATLETWIVETDVIRDANPNARTAGGTRHWSPLG